MEPVADPRRAFAVDVVRRLREAGHVAYWAGGCVRDLLLGKPPKDYDVATDARPERVQELFGKRYTRAVGATFGVILVHAPPKSGAEPIEVATFRSEGPYLDGRRPQHVVFCTAEEDAQRRDFTINGMFFDPVSEEVHDYVGGRADMANQIVRAIGNARDRFTEDKLRMLRAVRFAATLEFELEADTLAALQQMAPEIHIVSPERITQELKRMFVDSRRILGLELTREAGLLVQIFPELGPVLDPVERVADFSVWNRLLRLLQRLHQPGFEVVTAAIWQMFPGINTAQVEEMGKRLRLSNREVEHIGWLVANRNALDRAPELSLSRLKRLMAEPHVRDLLALARAEAEANNSELRAVEFCEQYLAVTPAEEIDPPMLVTGNDLIRHGLRPGPRFKSLLESIRDAQLEGRIATREEGLALAERLHKDGENAQ